MVEMFCSNFYLIAAIFWVSDFKGIDLTDFESPSSKVKIQLYFTAEFTRVDPWGVTLL